MGLLKSSLMRLALISADKHLRKAPRRKKQGLGSSGRSANMLDMRLEGFMSPDRGRLQMALYTW